MYYFVLEFDFKNKKNSPIGKRYDARLLLETEFIQWQEETKDRTPGKDGEPKVSSERFSNREYALDGAVQIMEQNPKAFGNDDEHDERVEKFKDAVRTEIIRREREYSKQHISDFPYYVETKTFNPRTDTETIEVNVLPASEAARSFYFDTYYEPFGTGYTNVNGAKTLNDALKAAFGSVKDIEMQGKLLERQRNRIIKLVGSAAKQDGFPLVVKAYYKENESIGKIVCYSLSSRNHPYVATIIEAKVIKQNFFQKLLSGSGSEPKVLATQTFTSQGDAEKWLIGQGLKEITSPAHQRELQLEKYKNWIELFGG